MLTYGTTPEQLAAVAARIRTNGHLNPMPSADTRIVLARRHPAASRMIADPALSSSTAPPRPREARHRPGGRGPGRPARPRCGCAGASDSVGPAYTVAPVWDFRHAAGRPPAGLVEAGAAPPPRAMAGLTPADVDVAELYDPFSFQIIRQLEAFGFLRTRRGQALCRGREHRAGQHAFSPSLRTAGRCAGHPGINAQQNSASSGPSSNSGDRAPPNRSAGHRSRALLEQQRRRPVLADRAAPGCGPGRDAPPPAGRRARPCRRPCMQSAGYWEGCRQHRLLFQV